ncbi:L,D-transpeptidase family protein [bacterium]|nr:L,D-transpeptidase family protein [bacterium]
MKARDFRQGKLTTTSTVEGIAMKQAKITLNERKNCPRAPHKGCWGSTAFGMLNFGGHNAAVTASGNRSYNIDVTLHSKDCYANKRSIQFQVDMPFAVGPIEWKTGVYVHQYPMMCSAGCIHLNLQDAIKFYEWVKANEPVRLVVKSDWN